jgi:hypothetical protein
MLLKKHEAERGRAMAGTRENMKPGSRNHGAFGTVPPAERNALKRYTDQDQLQPQGKYPARRRPTDRHAIEHPNLPERDRQ